MELLKDLFLKFYKMKLYILEGCHASGKTTILKKLTDIPVIDENFLNLKRFDYDSILHQLDWVLNWVESVTSLKNSGNEVAICDRGPNSIIIYGPNLMFDNIVKEIFKILEEKGIHIINLYLENPDINEHIKRIVERSGPLVEKELKNLVLMRDRYDEFCKDYKKINSTNIEEFIVFHK